MMSINSKNLIKLVKQMLIYSAEYHPVVLVESMDLGLVTDSDLETVVMLD